MHYSRIPAAGLLGGLLVLLPLTDTAAQDRARRTDEVPVFTLAGSRVVTAATEAQFVPSASFTPEPGARPPGTMAPSGPGRDAAMGSIRSRPGRPRSAVNLQAPAPGQLGDVTLTARRPWINDQAYLTYALPTSAHSGNDAITFNKNYGGGVRVYLNAAEGATYLVDFAVEAVALGQGTYRVSTASGTQDFPSGADPIRILAAVHASSAGWVSVYISRPEGPGFHFREARVTRVD